MTLTFEVTPFTSGLSPSYSASTKFTGSWVASNVTVCIATRETLATHGGDVIRTVGVKLIPLNPSNVLPQADVVITDLTNFVPIFQIFRTIVMMSINRFRQSLYLLVSVWLLSQGNSFSTQSSFARPNVAFGTGVRRQSSAFSTTIDQSSQEEVVIGDITPSKRVSRRSRLRNLAWRYSSLPRKPIRIYYNYVRQLWYETSTDARKRIAQDKAAEAIRAVENLVKEDEYVDFSNETTVARQKLLDACEVMLFEMRKAQESSSSTSKHALVNTFSTKVAKPERKRRSILFGATMGFCVACWVFSGNWIFTGLFTLMTILGQLEYYRMVINTGVYPARKISVVGACSMFLTVSQLLCIEMFFVCPVSHRNLVCFRRSLHRTYIKSVFPCLDYGPWFGF
jgi:hypothetical protein